MRGYEIEAAIFVVIFVIIMTIACVGVGWIGYGLLTQLGKFPSKTPQIHMSVLFPFVVVVVVSFTLLLIFLKVLEPLGQ